MKFDAYLLDHELIRVPEIAARIDTLGFDGMWTAETAHNPFLPLLLAAEHSDRISLGTAIAVAFPRSPTILAHMAWDLAQYSGGRFVLGLGTQVRAHNVLRLGATWEKPVRKLRETIEAIRAVWDCWQENTPLNYRGEFFNLRLMTPFFSPPPLAAPPPPIYISAVNQQMLTLAGRICDGVHIHPFHSVKYLREIAWPNLTAGMAVSERTRDTFTAVSAVFVVPTDGRKAATDHERFVREQIAFYMSTPGYRVIADLHGWTATATKLSGLARRGEWQAMPALISDDMLDTLAVTGTWAELPALIQARYGNLLDRVTYYLSYLPGEEDEGWAASVAGFHEAHRISQN